MARLVPIEDKKPRLVPVEEPGGSPSTAFLGRGIAQLFGLPGDLINAGNQFIRENTGFPAGRLPIGSQEIESGLRNIGEVDSAFRGMVPEEGEQADEFGDVAMREIGAGIASLIPLGGAARGAQTAVQAGRGGAVTRTLAEAAETAGRRPVATSLAEGASIGGAGVGAGAGFETGRDSDSQQALETMGALAGGFSPAVLATLPSTARIAGRAGRAAVDPFTRGGATFRAARRTQQLAADPRQAARNLSEDDILPEAEGLIPPAQRTDESRLVGLQRALTDEDPELERTLAGRTQEAERVAREAGEQMGGAPPESARRFLSERRDQSIERFQQRAGRAAARAQERLSRIDDASPEQQSRVVREELEGAERAAVEAEREIWGKVPRDIRVISQETRSAFGEIEAAQGKLSDPDDIPPLLREGIERVSGRENVGELQTFRSRILREIRAERAKDAPNRQKISNLEKMQTALLDDMSRAGPKRKGGEKLQEALAFSRVLNERLRQGPVGRILGYERRGGPSVPAGETLSRTIGRSREAGAENLDALRRAMGEGDGADATNEAMNRVLQAASTPEGRQSLDRFVQANFRIQAVNPDGTVSPSAARQFLKRNKEVLDRMPGTRARLQEAAESQRAAERALKRSDRLTRTLQQKAKSRLALYLDTTPERAMRRVIDSDNPSEAAQSLLNSARKDPTGYAEKGLKDEFVQTLMREAETGAVDETGQRMISGRRMRRLMENPQARKVMQRLLTAQERKRLDQIANTLARVESGTDRTPSVGKAMDDLASSILEIPSRVLGARAGASVGGSSMAGGLQSAQIFSGRVRDLLRSKFSDKAKEVLTDAVQDDDLFRKLMTMPTTRQKARTINRRLNAWLGSLPSEEDRQQEAQQQ